jgi:hypothetical protein
MRIPRMHGRPPHWFGLKVIRCSWLMSGRYGGPLRLQARPCDRRSDHFWRIPPLMLARSHGAAASGSARHALASRLT